MSGRQMRAFLLLTCFGSLGAAAALPTVAAAQPQRQPAQELQLEYLQRNPVPTGDFISIPIRAFDEARGQNGSLITQNGVYVISGPDGNVTIFMGPDGVFVVDSQRKENGPGLLSEIDKIRLNQPIRIFATTSGDENRAGAGQLIREAGRQVFGGNVAGQASDLADQAIHIAHENVLNSLSGSNGRDQAVEEGMWPKETYASDIYDFYFNGEGVQLVHTPGAHSDGDSVVYFRKSDVIAVGDLWDTTAYPRIDTARGGSINGVVDGLTHIIDLTIPGEKQEGGTVVVPGRGRVGDESDVVEYRDMLAIIRDRIKDMAAKGMTLDQVKAAKPTFDFDVRYGATAGPWTTDMFIAAVYEGVKPQRGRAAR